MTATSIRVDASTRDRLNALAESEGISAGSMVEKLLEEHLWRRQVESAKRQMREAPAEVWAEYMAETATMDPSLADGLGDW